MTLDSSDSTRPSLLLRLRAPEDREAWNTCVEVYGPLIYEHCRRARLAHADAEDVTQEVFARLSTAIRTFDYQPDLGRFRSWLGTVARNEISRFLKKKSQETSRRETATPLEQLADAREDVHWNAAFNGHVLRMALERCRPHFEPPTWRAFERAWIDQRPATEVAREMSRDLDWVYVAKSRVLKALFQEVRELADDTILAAYSSRSS